MIHVKARKASTYDRHVHRPLVLFRSITKEELLAKQVRFGTIPQLWFLDRYGEARQMRLNGKVKTWKRDPDRIEVPCKYGFYSSGCWRETNLHNILVEV